jgi:hypothetical protein
LARRDGLGAAKLIGGRLATLAPALRGHFFDHYGDALAGALILGVGTAVMVLGI